VKVSLCIVLFLVTYDYATCVGVFSCSSAILGIPMITHLGWHLSSNRITGKYWNHDLPTFTLITTKMSKCNYTADKHTHTHTHTQPWVFLIDYYSTIIKHVPF